MKLVAALAVTSLAAVLAAACSSEPERSADAYCAQVGGVRDLSTVIAEGDRQALASDVEALRALQAVAPTEIEPSVALLVTVTADLSTTRGTVPDAAAAADEVFARRRADVEAITAAGRAVEDYTLRTCGIVLNTTDTAPRGSLDSGSTVAPGSTTTR